MKAAVLGAGLAAGLALGGCGMFGGPAAPPRSPDEVACAAQADDDPTVKQMILKGVGNPVYLAEGQDALKAARQDARLRCLRARGVVRPGGVERQRPL